MTVIACVQETNAGTLKDLLAELNINPETPYSGFVTRLKEATGGPSGMQIPSTEIRIGGPTTPGAPKANYEFELLQPETVGEDGRPTAFGVRVPVVHGAVPDTLPMKDVINMLHNPQVTVVRKFRCFVALEA